MIKLKTKKIPHCFDSSKIHSKNRNKGEIDTPKTQMHDRLLSWLGTDTSIKSDGVKLVLKAQALGEMIRLMKKKKISHN